MEAKRDTLSDAPNEIRNENSFSFFLLAQKSGYPPSYLNKQTCIFPFFLSFLHSNTAGYKKLHANITVWSKKKAKKKVICV